MLAGSPGPPGVPAPPVVGFCARLRLRLPFDLHPFQNAAWFLIFLTSGLGCG